MCVHLDPETRRPIEGLTVQWMFEYPDGTTADTSEVAKSVKSVSVKAGSALRLQGIYKTASGIRAKCVAHNARSGLDTEPGTELEGPLNPNEVVSSPSISFNVTPATLLPEKEREWEPLKPEMCKLHLFYLIFSRETHIFLI